VGGSGEWFMDLDREGGNSTFVPVASTDFEERMTGTVKGDPQGGRLRNAREAASLVTLKHFAWLEKDRKAHSMHAVVDPRNSCSFRKLD
jgi:hypothetical protein